MATATPPIVLAHDEILILDFTPSLQPLHLFHSGFSSCSIGLHPRDSLTHVFR